METDLVKGGVDKGVHTIVLNSPSNRNALSRALVNAVHERLDQAERNGRVVVLRATGSTFCAGADMKEGTSGDSSPQPPNVFQRIANFPLPVIAVVQGAVRAAGIALVASADISIGTDRANFAVSEVHRGLIPASISVVCAQRLNFRRMQQYFLTGERFDATTAVDMGLLSEYVGEDGVQERLAVLTDLLAQGAPNALVQTKLILRDVTIGDPTERFEEMLQRSRQAFESADGQEGMRAFLEKRPPSWMADLA